MKLNKNIFREYDIRGVYGIDIDEEISFQIGLAFGTKLKRLGKKITLVGYDNRLSSPIIEENVVKGITMCGVDVIRLGMVTTPIYYYGWDLLNVKCGMMITASHNPKDDNGFKFSYNGINNAYGENTLEIYNMIVNRDFDISNDKGIVTNCNIIPQYVDMILNSVSFGNRKIKVVYDCGNGTTSIVCDEIFKRLNKYIDAIPICNVSDGNFPNHHPDPSVLENLSMLSKSVVQNNALLGVSYDGDGDRVGFVDDKGNMINIDEFMIIIWRDLVKNKNISKKTFYDVKCSLSLKEELDKLGVESEFYRTGNSYTKEKSSLGNYPFSGELSGHVFFRDKFIGTDDGIYASLRMIEILTKCDKNVSSLLEGVNKYYSTREEKISCSDDIKSKVIDYVKNYCINKGYKILTIDGVKVFFDDGSALVRASNTGPNITTRFEAKTKDRLDSIKKEFVDLINLCNSK